MAAKKSFKNSNPAMLFISQTSIEPAPEPALEPIVASSPMPALKSAPKPEPKATTQTSGKTAEHNAPKTATKNPAKASPKAGKNASAITTNQASHAGASESSQASAKFASQTPANTATRTSTQAAYDALVSTFTPLHRDESAPVDFPASAAHGASFENRKAAGLAEQSSPQTQHATSAYSGSTSSSPFAGHAASPFPADGTGAHNLSSGSAGGSALHGDGRQFAAAGQYATSGQYVAATSQHAGFTGQHAGMPPMKLNPLYIETKSRRLNLLVQPSLHEKVKVIAQQRGVSVNEMIHQILQEFTER